VHVPLIQTFKALGLSFAEWLIWWSRHPKNSLAVGALNRFLIGLILPIDTGVLKMDSINLGQRGPRYRPKKKLDDNKKNRCREKRKGRFF